MRETDGLEQTGGITGEISKIIALVSTQFQSILGLCSIRPILSVRDGITAVLSDHGERETAIDLLVSLWKL